MDSNKIEPARYYSVRQLMKMNVLPWRSAMTIAKALKEERWKEVFRPMVDQKEKSTRMYVKGERILEFIEATRRGDFSQ